MRSRLAQLHQSGATDGQVVAWDDTLMRWVPADATGGADGEALSPSATVTAVKSGSNPTLTETGSMPENIIKVGPTYWLVYSRRVSGSYTRIHLASATSPDGPWTPYGSNPILTVGDQTWETPDVTNGACIIEVGGTFYLFYGATPGTGKTAGIGVASASAITGPYTKYASNPVLSPSASGWDSLRVQEPSVIVVDGTWVMAYMAEDAASAQGTTEKIGIATASSPFGPWTKDAANPVIGFGASGFDVGGAADPSLLYEGGYYWCLYSGLAASGGKPWQLGLAYASSPSGPWTRHSSNPILTVGASGAFDGQAAWRGALYREGSTYHLPYGGIPASGQSYDAKGGNATVVVVGGADPLAAHESSADPHPQYLTQFEGDDRYVRTVNGVGPDASGDVTVATTTAFLPLTTVVAGVPDLVWDADDSLIPTEVPL